MSKVFPVSPGDSQSVKLPALSSTPVVSNILRSPESLPTNKRPSTASKLLKSSGGDDNRLPSPYLIPLFASDQDVIEFAAVESLVFEHMEAVELTVARRGPSTNRITVNYKNVNINVAAKNFLPLSGSVTLEPNEKTVSFTMKVGD